MLSSVKAADNVKANPTASTASAAARKRQRRQAAASFLFPTAAAPAAAAVPTMGRKSTAQPRPAVHVPPRGIGPIAEPNVNDVLCGRGGRINSHAGNIQFRDMVAARKKEYLAKSTKKLEKAHIAAKIVEEIRSMDPPGRFLKEDAGSGLWWDIGDQKAIKKSGQALREDAPDLRQEIDGGDGEDADSGDNDETKKPAKKEEGSPKKELKPIQEASEQKPVASTTAIPKVQVPKTAAHGGVAAGRHNVRTPTISNNSRGSDSPASQEPLPVGNGPQLDLAQQQRIQAPQAYIVDETGAGMAYADYMQRLHAQQQQLAGQPYFIPFSQPQVTANPNVASAVGNIRNPYNYPSQLIQGVKSFAQKATNFSEKASEVMQAPQPHPHAGAGAGVATPGIVGGGADHNMMVMGRLPPTNVAFGRNFYPPTELSSGSTMSTISGLSSVMNAEGSLLSLSSTRSLGLTNGSVLSGLDLVEQQQRAQAAAIVRANNIRAAQIIQDQRRLSQLSELRGAGGSDLTFSLRSFGSISRSHSFPDLSNSIREEMRMFDESFANPNNSLAGDMSLATATMAPSVAPPARHSPPPAANEGPSTQNVGSGDAPVRSSPHHYHHHHPSERGERPPTASNRSISTASAMSLSVASISLASGASRGSYNISDASSFNRFPLPDDSNRSILSDLSNEIVALDLAGTPRPR